MRVILALFLFFGALLAALDDDIVKQRNLLDKSSQKKEQLSQKLKELANTIIKEQNSIKTIEKKEKALENRLSKSKDELTVLEKKEQELKAQESKLHQKKSALEQQLVEFLAKDISFSFVKSEIESSSESDFINEEIFNSLNEIAKKNIEELKKGFEETVKELDGVNTKLENTKERIASIRADKKELELLKKEKRDVIASLSISQQRYKDELNEILKRQDEIADLLESLQIKKKEQDRARQKEVITKEDQEFKGKDVRKIGHSYVDVATEKYTGKKTIPPIENYTVINKFGPYFDPVYNIKIFNESVTLQPQTSNTKVRSVFDGVVVFARETSVMEKVVIIEHKNNLHTIYGYLSKIAPTIKPGITVKKGYVVGRVDDKLMFEVTKKNRYINPEELF
ncbi:MAG: murein hydrolase activator EnvC family protein [Campylobacterales bacterium]